MAFPEEDAGIPPEAPARFRVVEVLGGLSIVISGTLAVATLLAANAPDLGVGAVYPFAPVWGFALIAWSLALLDETRDRVASIAAVLLVAGSIAAMAANSIIFVMLVHKPNELVGPLAVALGLVGVVFARERARRLRWAAVPVLVLAAMGLIVTGMHGSVPLPS